MMDLHQFCATIGAPILAVAGVGLGLAAMKIDLLAMLQLKSLRQPLQYLVGAVGALCLVDFLMHLAK